MIKAKVFFIFYFIISPIETPPSYNQHCTNVEGSRRHLRAVGTRIGYSAPNIAVALLKLVGFGVKRPLVPTKTWRGGMWYKVDSMGVYVVIPSLG